jgi:Na+-driven multidrug efflux pump
MQPIVIWSFVLMGVMMILTGTMRAYGAVILPLVIMAVSLYPARLGFYFLAFPLIRARRCGGPIPSPRRWGLVVLYVRGGWRKAVWGEVFGGIFYRRLTFGRRHRCGLVVPAAFAHLRTLAKL